MTPDGTHVIFREFTPATLNDLGILTLDQKRETQPLLKAARNQYNGEISPGGRWLAYQSDESGQHEVYVRPFPNVNSGRWHISTAGGTRPVWARNGHELFYLDASNMLTAVPVAAIAKGTMTPPRRFHLLLHARVLANETRSCRL